MEGENVSAREQRGASWDVAYWVEHGCCSHQHTAAGFSWRRKAHTKKHKDGGTVGKRNLVSRSRGGESSTGGNMIAMHGMHGIQA